MKSSSIPDDSDEDTTKRTLAKQVARDKGKKTRASVKRKIRGREQDVVRRLPMSTSDCAIADRLFVSDDNDDDHKKRPKRQIVAGEDAESTDTKKRNIVFDYEDDVKSDNQKRVRQRVRQQVLLDEHTMSKMLLVTTSESYLRTHVMAVKVSEMALGIVLDTSQLLTRTMPTSRSSILRDSHSMNLLSLDCRRNLRTTPHPRTSISARLRTSASSHPCGLCELSLKCLPNLRETRHPRTSTAARLRLSICSHPFELRPQSLLLVSKNVLKLDYLPTLRALRSTNPWQPRTQPCTQPCTHPKYCTIQGASNQICVASFFY